MTDARDFSSTLNLPKTSFPMRAGLPKTEPARLMKWEQEGVYELVLKKNEGKPTFILHDGPPYANGPIHIGHAMNKITKDIINRYWMMQGFNTPFVPGWDCHGLPIEHKVETELGTETFRKTSVSQIRALCHEYAVDNIDVQRRGFKRLGVLGQWEDPYLTFVHDYDAAEIEIFKAFFDKGAIYRGHKPVHWCKHCHTALADAEIEYGEEVSPSIYVRFEMIDRPAGLDSYTEPVDIIIWTTTPWTLPANVAVCLAPDAEYVAVRASGRLEIVAADLLEKVCAQVGWDALRVEGFCAKGIELAGLTYRHPIFDDVHGVLIYGDHVTLDDGTGAVHTAPGHGIEDYNIGARFNLDIIMPVDDNGCFYTGQGFGSGGEFSGMDTDQANPLIIEFLQKRNTLVSRLDIAHSYPHCWRCKNPVIFRATDQWFVSMDATGLRADAIDAIQNQVRWYPPSASRRIGAMVSQRPDWCISRQRNWGVPIPSFTCQDCGAKVMNDDTLDAVIALFKEKGSDAWFTDKPSDYLGSACVCPACGSSNLKADADILDVWWDSGISHTAVLSKLPNLSFPADMYLEGSDQHRGWFQSALLTSVGAYGVAPYRSVLSQGFVLDGQGRKMSKSLGNVIDPNDVCTKMGADIIRLWVASTDTANDVAIDAEILARTADAYRRFRNSVRFLLSELYDFDPESNSVAFEELVPIDACMLARMCDIHSQVEEAYRDYRFNVVYRTLYDFVVTELSNVYMDVVKDRTYCGRADSVERRSAQTVMAHILSMLVHDLQPILVFTCDEIVEYLPSSLRDGQPFAALFDWYTAPLSAEELCDLLPVWNLALEVRDATKKALEPALAEKTISKSQEASALIRVSAADYELLKKSGLDVAELCIISNAELEIADVDTPQVQISLASGARCPRCWNMRTLETDGLCRRCHDALSE